MTKCIYCNDSRVVWTTGNFGMSTATPCPRCNKNGNAVREETAELEFLHKRKPYSRKYKGVGK